MILPVILYGSETWSSLRKQSRDKGVWQWEAGKVLKKDKWEEVAGGWRKLDMEELQDLYFLPDIVGVINQGGWDG